MQENICNVVRNLTKTIIDIGISQNVTENALPQSHVFVNVCSSAGRVSTNFAGMILDLQMDTFNMLVK